MGNRYHTIRLHKKRPKKGEKPPKKPKAFKSEEAAKKWAEAQGIKGYRIEAIAEKKFKIRTK